MEGDPFPEDRMPQGIDPAIALRMVGDQPDIPGCCVQPAASSATNRTAASPRMKEYLRGGAAIVYKIQLYF